MGKSLSTTQAAERLGINAATLRDWVRRGWVGATRRPNGHWQFTEEEIEAIRAGERYAVDPG